jgi:hypothetical protein
MKGVVSGMKMTEVNGMMARHLITDVTIIDGIPDISTMDINKGILIVTEESFPDIIMMNDLFPDDSTFLDDSSVILDENSIQDIHQLTWPSVNEDPIFGR